MRPSSLRAIQEPRIDRVGGTKAVPCRHRIIRPDPQLVEAVERANFREDLLFRPRRGEPQDFPAVRERPADVIEASPYFITKNMPDANACRCGHVGEARRPGAQRGRPSAGAGETPSTARCCSRSARRSVSRASWTPDGMRLDSPEIRPAVRASGTSSPAETVTRALVGRTVAEGRARVDLETIKHCLGKRTPRGNILGILDTPQMTQQAQRVYRRRPLRSTPRQRREERLAG